MSPSARIKSHSAAALRRRRDELSYLEKQTISQAELAERTGGVLSQKLISTLETGASSVSSLSVGRANALATALGWTLWELQQATGEDLHAQPPDWVQILPRPPRLAV